MFGSQRSGRYRGPALRRLRFEHGEMTQAQLAKQAGVRRHTIMAVEAGKYFPSLLLAFGIARAFGRVPARLVTVWLASPWIAQCAIRLAAQRRKAVPETVGDFSP